MLARTSRINYSLVLILRNVALLSLFVCSYRFEFYKLKIYMIINFKTHEINQDMHKLVWTFTLIKKIIN
jgi:hypothetical protein